ncbi:MAG TPA: hypothetical protein VF704_12775 [Allosphingosinicella sp.]|jgi:hypothetical protein
MPILPLLFLIAAGPLAAQPAATAGPADLNAFVDAVTVQAEGQVARFHEPVCVVAEGLPDDFNLAVEARVRELAGAARIRTARERGCRANFIILVANDGAEVASALRRRRPDIFNGLNSVEVSRAIAATGPVRSWQSSVTRRAEGAMIADNRDAFLHQDVHLHHGVPVGLLRETTRRDLQLSVVVFDVDAVDGLTLMQIADHAAMRGLAPTRPAEAAAGRSILSLFDRAAGDRAQLPAVTRLDLSYLRALYRIEGALDGTAHRRLLARLIENGGGTERR